MDSESRSTDPVVITGLPIIAEAADFEGKPVTTIQYQGRPCWPAREIGQALGYEDDGRGLVDLIRREWAEELIEYQDFMVLDGQELRDLKRLLEPNVSDTFGRHVAHLLLLFESGVHICCVKTSKPVGLKLRRFIADRVLSQIVRDGSYLPDRQVVNGQLQLKDGADARALAPIDPAQLAHTIHTSIRTIFHGELIPAILDELKEVVGQVIEERSSKARQDDSTIGTAGAAHISSALKDIARKIAPDDKRRQRSVRSAVEMDLRTALNHYGTGRTWHSLPMSKWGEVEAELEKLMRQAERMSNANQLPLFREESHGSAPSDAPGGAQQ